MGAPTETGRPTTLFLLLSAATLALDQTTKAIAARALRAGSSLPVLGDWVQLTLTRNIGSAFGLISAGWVLVAAGALVCAVILAYVLRGRLLRAPGRALPLALIFGGSLGNLVDRIRTGAVVDFIDLRVWPVFNFADAAITLGVLLFAHDLFRRN